MSQPINLEICANSAQSALAAQRGGAVRVELCENLKQAGTTPSFGQIATARKLIDIKLYVLIRPRPGDFLYSDEEFEIMLTDAENCINQGCDGIVIGILKRDGSIDMQRCGRLVNLAHKHKIGATFHRAFDVCADFTKALEDIIELGFERVLTSGGKITAMEGAGAINHLVKQAAGRISIMAGSGINPHNVANIVRFTGVTEVHTSARKQVASLMDYQNDNVVMGKQANDLYAFDETNVDYVKEILRLANS